MSLKALLLDQVLRRVFAQTDDAGSVYAEVARRLLQGAPKPAAVPHAVRKRLRVDEREVPGRPVVTLQGRAGAAHRAVVFIPGGGYAQPVSTAHRKTIAEAARRRGIDAVVPLYQVAPQGDAAAAHALVRAVIDETIATYGPGNVHVTGDSGGGLALSVVQRQPDGVRSLILLSPWTDVELTHPAIGAFAAWDVILRVEELRAWGAVWAAGASTSNPAVSPIRGPLGALPPVHIATGGSDLLPDALALHQRLVEHGNHASLIHAPNANHAAGLLGPASPEGAHAYRAVVEALDR